jgi:glutathione S-transferase
MQAKPKLYGDKGSQPVRAVLALLAIGRIDFEFVPVDLSSFETRSKEYRELNPFAHIPFLVDGKFKLSESSAILLYLCEKYPHLPKTLSGRTIEERAIINQYLSWYQN